MNKIYCRMILFYFTTDGKSRCGKTGLAEAALQQEQHTQVRHRSSTTHTHCWGTHRVCDPGVTLARLTVVLLSHWQGFSFEVELTGPDIPRAPPSAFTPLGGRFAAPLGSFLFFEIQFKLCIAESDSDFTACHQSLVPFCLVVNAATDPL